MLQFAKWMWLWAVILHRYPVYWYENYTLKKGDAHVCSCTSQLLIDVQADISGVGFCFCFFLNTKLSVLS